MEDSEKSAVPVWNVSPLATQTASWRPAGQIRQISMIDVNRLHRCGIPLLHGSGMSALQAKVISDLLVRPSHIRRLRWVFETIRSLHSCDADVCLACRCSDRRQQIDVELRQRPGGRTHLPLMMETRRRQGV